jgi:hypothetical protein
MHPPAPHRSRAFFGACLSALCAAHCLVTPWLAGALPAAATAAEAEWLEWGLWALAGGACLWLVVTAGGRVGRVSKALGLGLVAASATALAAESEPAQRIALVCLAVYQLLLVLRLRRPAAVEACCAPMAKRKLRARGLGRPGAPEAS